MMFILIYIGLCHGLLISVTRFRDENKGSKVFARDVFDAPVTMDSARRIFFFFRWLHPVVLWQLAKRQQVLTLCSKMGSVLEHFELEEKVTNFYTTSF